MKSLECKLPGYNGERIRRPRDAYVTFDKLIDDVYQWFDEHDLHDPVMQMVKVQEEVGELAHEVARSNFKSLEIIDALGDSFVTIIGMCHHLHIDPTFALFSAYEEIRDRKGKTINNSFVKETDEKDS
jgi:NTP pyrophosphatase (non-canonical NTP hydrolase)